MFDKYGGREYLLNEERKEGQLENYGEYINLENEGKHRKEKVSSRFFFFQFKKKPEYSDMIKYPLISYPYLIGLDIEFLNHLRFLCSKNYQKNTNSKTEFPSQISSRIEV